MRSPWDLFEMRLLGLRQVLLETLPTEETGPTCEDCAERGRATHMLFDRVAERWTCPYCEP